MIKWTQVNEFLGTKYDISLYADHAYNHTLSKEIRGYEYDQLLSSYFSEIIDMDNWKHSWHLATSRFKEKEIRDKIAEIIVGKIEKRTRQTERLKDAYTIIMSQVIYEEEN